MKFLAVSRSSPLVGPRRRSCAKWRGCAAAILSGEGPSQVLHLLLLDWTPWSIGLETAGGHNRGARWGTACAKVA